MPQPSPEYVPGVCNIGGAEVRNRRWIGIGGLVATLVLFVVLIAADAPPLMHVLLFLPAFAMATGLMQAKARFCTAYGARGLSNFTERVGLTSTSEVPEEIRADRARARRITTHALVAAVLVVLVAVGIASLV